ncbi:MAG: hypothetical protein E7082_07015 [Bacteroidales bacterium]|nr:hypothetical protein [Bacteroidales bacterium]
MTTPTTSNSRIAKNTLLLYIRMAIAMLVTLYTSRVVLQALGVDDFGIWSVVGTLVVMISFVTSPLASATQRFINVALGKNDENNASKIFSQSLILYAGLAVCAIVIFETVGLWFLTTKMDIPTVRMEAAMSVFHIAIASFIISVVKVPFDAIIIAHQRFGFYAIAGILDVILKLIIVFFLRFAPNNETLIFYAFLMFVVAAVDITIRAIYCFKRYKYYRPKWIWDKPLVKELLSFTGWSTLGAFASVTGNQGLSIVLNLFFGVAANAAMGLANQVASAVNQFVSNFQLAFQPQIVQSYAAEDKQSTFNLVCLASKVSFLLIFAIGGPIVFNIDYILSLWLGDVPAYTSQFCILVISIAIIEAIGAPLWMTIQATGKIRNYQIIISTFLILTIIIGYILLKLNFSAPSILVGKLFVILLCLLYRILAVQHLTGFSIRRMVKGFLVPELIVMAITCSISVIMTKLIPESPLIQLIGSTITFLTTLILLSWHLILTSTQRKIIIAKFKFK